MGHYASEMNDPMPRDYGTRPKPVGWQPIETAPKDAWILIADDKCWPPDLVHWQPERKERWVNGNRYLAVPEGWFGSPGGRSRFDVPDGHLMKATRWMPLPPK